MQQFGWEGTALALTCGAFLVDACYELGMWLLARVVCGDGE
jgi:hypothetical protein